MLGITNYFWRLLPANPILLRVVETGGRRQRDLIIRCGYLGLMIGLVILAVLPAMGTGSLSDLAKISATIFQRMSYVQLALVALLAPIFTAGAITQEKDSQTYDILLATPLSNGQIVLGSLLSRLFFVIALLISGIPIFSITQIFGGVAIWSIVLSFLIAAATAFVTGAMAMAIATFKVGTRRTIFSFYLFIVIYLVGIFLLDQLPFFRVDLVGDPQAGLAAVSTTSWLTGLHPFLALRVIFNDPEYMPPLLAELPAALQRWPIGWYLTSPHGFYISFMMALSLMLVLPSIVLLRRMAQSTMGLKSWVLQKLHLSSGDRRRRPRYVWHNPIAWREAKTKASAARASIMRYGFMAGGFIGAVVVVWMFSTDEPVGQYIHRNSYAPGHETLSIVQGDRAVTLAVTRQTTVKINGQEARLEDLRGRYAVQYTTHPANPGQIATITARDIPRRLSAADARTFLLGMILVEFAVILLIVTNAAASTVTREKEDGTLDLLLATPITSRYYIWGKLRGLVSYVLPLVAIPVLSVGVFVVYDMLRLMRGEGSSFQWTIYPEALLIMPGTLVMAAAFASILGMQMSLRCRTTVRAVMSSVGIVVGVAGFLGWCGFAVLDNMGRTASGVGLVIGSFSPVTLLMVLIDPQSFAGGAFDPTTSDVTVARLITFIFSWAAVGVYAGVVWAMYASMVKNFDMTVRRQAM